MIKKTPEEKEATAKVVIASAYLHISQGGVTISVNDTGYGPEIEIESSNYGNNVITQSVKVSKGAFGFLAEMFTKAAAFDFQNEEYCNPARVCMGNEGNGLVLEEMCEDDEAHSE